MIRTDAPPLNWLVYEADWSTLGAECREALPAPLPVDLAPYLDLMRDRAIWIIEHLGSEGASETHLDAVARFVGARLRLGMAEIDRSFFERGAPVTSDPEGETGESDRCTSPPDAAAAEGAPSVDGAASPRTPIQTPSRVLAIGMRQRAPDEDPDAVLPPVPASWPYALLCLALLRLAARMADEAQIYAHGFGPAPCMAAAMEALTRAEEAAHNALTASAARQNSGWEAFTELVVRRVLADGDLAAASGREAAERICREHAGLLQELGKDPLSYADSLRRLINRKRKDRALAAAD
jgi:hypothetical protein